MRLTPAGTGAIAVIAAEAASVAKLFSKPLPPVGQFCFGRLLGDDVVVSRLNESEVEVHCHGGVGIVDLIQSHLKPTRGHGWALERATTLRVANILLDQCTAQFTIETLNRLESLIPLGRHLLTPFKVAIVGPPNVGKSSLINALAGYERAVVSPIAGTTRDVTRTAVAFDGWPIELIDTAGQREADDALEAEGIARARAEQATADLVISVAGVADPGPGIEPGSQTPAEDSILVANKCDRPDFVRIPDSLAVSALTGEGIPSLIAAIVRQLVPVVPAAGEAVPVSEQDFAMIREARSKIAAGDVAAARTILSARRDPPE